jgi:protein-tyrosine-phosphatase
MAKALMDKVIEESTKKIPLTIRTLSAGTNACENAPLSEYAARALLEFGIELKNHRARRLTKAMIKQADLILVMEKEHIKGVLDLVPQAMHKTFLIAEYAGLNKTEIFDPLGQSLTIYKKVAQELYSLAKKIFKKLIEQNFSVKED